MDTFGIVKLLLVTVAFENRVSPPSKQSNAVSIIKPGKPESLHSCLF